MKRYNLGKYNVRVKAVKNGKEAIDSIDAYVMGVPTFDLNETSVQHNMINPIEDLVTDTTVGGHNWVELYDASDDSLLGEGASGNDISSFVDWVGPRNVYTKVALKEGANKTYLGRSANQMVTGLNTAPAHPECDDADDFFQMSAGGIVNYTLPKSDFNNDVVNIETEYGLINPNDVYFEDFGSFVGVTIDTTGLTTGTYTIKHRANDSYDTSDWEEVRIKIN